MKKIVVILLSILVVIVTMVIMFTREYSQAVSPQTVSLDETIIDVTRLEEYKSSPITWISHGKKYHPLNYNEISIVREGWSLDGSVTSQPRMFQVSLLYKNKMQAGLAFYLFAPNRVYKYDWPNDFVFTGNYTKEAEIELNANRYRFYCGIGPKDKCQIWYYWAQYENYLVLLGLYDIGDASSIEEFGRIVSELDTHFSDVIGD